jgi:outer membrane protein
MGAILWIGLQSSELTAQRDRQRIALVDSDFILSKLPEYNGLGQTLNQMTIQWEQEITEEEEKLKELEDEFSAKEILYTEEVRKQKLTAIEAQEKRIAQLNRQRFGPEGDYFKEQQKLLEPIQRKVWEAIEVIANRDNFDIVFDRSGEVLVMFASAEWDISKEVLLELGVDLENQN